MMLYRIPHNTTRGAGTIASVALAIDAPVPNGLGGVFCHAKGKAADVRVELTRNDVAAIAASLGLRLVSE